MSPPDRTDVVSAFLDAIADRIASTVVDRLRAAEAPGWIDQSRSPLGPRRHRAAVQRRLGTGETGAALIGRRHLLTQEAIDEELARVATRRPKHKTETLDALAGELGLRMVKGGRK